MKWYQLHLSTVSAASVFAGVLIWLNVRPHLTGEITWNHARGWPSPFEVWYDDALNRYQWDWPTLALDVAVCLLLLALVGAGIEWVTRRMKRGAR